MNKNNKKSIRNSIYVYFIVIIGLIGIINFILMIFLDEINFPFKLLPTTFVSILLFAPLFYNWFILWNYVNLTFSDKEVINDENSTINTESQHEDQSLYDKSNYNKFKDGPIYGSAQINFKHNKEIDKETTYTFYDLYTALKIIYETKAHPTQKDYICLYDNNNFIVLKLSEHASFLGGARYHNPVYNISYGDIYVCTIEFSPYLCPETLEEIYEKGAIYISNMNNCYVRFNVTESIDNFYANFLLSDTIEIIKVNFNEIITSINS